MPDTRISSLAPEKTSGFDGSESLAIDDGTNQRMLLGRVTHQVNSKTNSVNMLAHSAVNFIDPGATGSVIAGGGGAVPAGDRNEILAANSDWSCISGGYDNTLSAQACVIAGGAHHTIAADAGHGTIGGGSTNSMSNGEYNTICGGGGATTPNTITGERNVIAGGGNHTITANWANIAGGRENQVTADYAAVLSGFQNSATAVYATVVGGFSCLASGSNSVCLGGNDSEASESGAVSIGYFCKSAIQGGHAWTARKNDANGDAQGMAFAISNKTTDATLTRLVVFGSGTYARIPINSAWAGTLSIVAREGATNSVSAWKIDFCCKMNGTTATLAAQNVTSIVNELTLANPSVDINTGGFFRVNVTGTAGKTIHWAASVGAVQAIG